MTIKTKYDMGDEVWVMWCNSPAAFEIDKVILIHDYNETIIQYKVKGCKYFFESEIFPTKEELLKSLQYDTRRI